MATPDQIANLCLQPGGSIRDALRVIERGSSGICLLVDNQQHLLGTITDGDVRRALIAGAQLDDEIGPYARRNFTSVGLQSSRTEVLDLMQARHLHQIPIVDDSGKLCGLHLMRQILGSQIRPNWAVIMAGGKGTRLDDLTRNIPKPMLKVAGRPILERLVLHLVGSGIRRLFISVNYLADIITDHFGDGSRHGCSIEYLREDNSEPLGTGGSLSLLPPAPEHPVFVCNGDLVTQVDVECLFDFHAQGGYAATIGARNYQHEIPFGCMEVDGGQVTSLIEKPTLTQLINAGIYVLSPEIIARVPRRPLPITDLFTDSLARGERLGAFPIVDEWIDVGQREQLRQARAGAHS
jgi:dTDP-glucose pyrophosphorylase